jgi:hypothetical protein
MAVSFVHAVSDTTSVKSVESSFSVIVFELFSVRTRSLDFDYVNIFVLLNSTV